MSLYYNCRQTLQRIHIISATQDSTYTRISATQGSTYTVQHGNVSSHTWNTAIQGALGLLSAAKVPSFYTSTHFAYPGGMTRLSWPGWLVKTERVGTGFEPIPSQY